MPEQRQPSVKDKDWLAIVRQQRCCICNDDTSIEAHHPRVGSIENGKVAAGMGERCSDRWAVALCGRHHRMLHAQGEREFWASWGVDPFAVALNYGRPGI